MFPLSLYILQVNPCSMWLLYLGAAEKANCKDKTEKDNCPNCRQNIAQQRNLYPYVYISMNAKYIYQCCHVVKIYAHHFTCCVCVFLSELRGYSFR